MVETSGSVTFIFVHYAVNEARSELARKSIQSLIDTTKNVLGEIIVVDNGGSLEDSKYFLEKAEKKEIQHYIRNADNLWFGYARNQAVKISNGEFLAFTDNDILYQEGWIEECLEVLKETKGQKLFVTPLEVDRAHLQQKYFIDKRNFCGKPMWINVFAGSNSWVMRREDFYIIGEFVNHPIAGTKWGREYARLKYGVVVIPNPKAGHLGLKGTPYAGYNKGAEVTIEKTFTNSQKIILYPWK